MIMVEIYFAELNRTYDFRVEENVAVAQLVEDVVGKIAQLERIPVEKDPGVFILCSKRDRRIFDRDTTLAQNRICSGDQIMLI